VLGVTDPDTGAPAVVQVAATGDRLLAFYPLVLGKFRFGGQMYAVINLQSGEASWITLDDLSAPEYAWVALVTFAPDGSKLLMVSRLTSPDYQVFIRDLGTGKQVTVLPEGLSGAAPVEWGVLPTWATNGTVLITDGARLSAATLLAIA
jgi:hypothetical protein